MSKVSRKYLRDLSTGSVRTAQRAYKFHLKPKRDGFLGKNHKQRILRLKKWREASDRDVYDFFYDIRERAKSALIDFQFLCEFLTEEQLKVIFAEKEKTAGIYPLTLFLSALLPTSTYRMQPKQAEKLQLEQAWRKLILEDLMIKGLSWYIYGGILKTDSHRRMVIDTMDAVAIMSSGKKRVVRTQFDSFYET